MAQRISPRSLLFAALAAGALACASSAALAVDAEYCVTCKNPDETYRCRVTGAGSRPSDALKLYCVIRTAKEGNHASCSAEKATNACVGLVKVYAYDGPALPQNVISDPRVRELKQRVEHNQQAFEKPKGDEAPKTLFELGGRAVDASAKGLRGARSLIGGTPSGGSPPAPAAPPPTSSLPDTASAPVPAAQPPESPGTAQRVKQAAQSAGSAVGGFARKSYNCVLSLFRECRE
jgi:hypothetical protein